MQHLQIECMIDEMICSFDITNIIRYLQESHYYVICVTETVFNDGYIRFDFMIQSLYDVPEEVFEEEIYPILFNLILDPEKTITGVRNNPETEESRVQSHRIVYSDDICIDNFQFKLKI